MNSYSYYNGFVSTTILNTKLYIPPPPPKGILRPRLIERLTEGLHHKLTLISAPAGFGKTTLVSEWIAGRSRQCEPEVCTAWLSLDEGDSDPARFLTYLVAALRTVVPNIGDRVLDALQSSQPLPIEPILTALLNEITTVPGFFVLVLDDYHLIDAQPVDGALTFLLEHLPTQMHLVITTREDPRLPLARLRARGQLTELRASDLRFTAAEAAGFLQSMGLNLSAEDVAALESRTEGWIAGLQLAALALQETLSVAGHQEVPEFIQAFAGDHRYIVDYLVEEVLQRQPEHIRTFLLQTSILDRLYGPLCSAVTGQEEGSAQLEALQRGNFFVIPLDDRRHWYRYHHLFAEVLYVNLIARQPEQVSVLHNRASIWYEQNGSAVDAIRHALAARDFDRAADLIERVVPAMRRNRQEGTVFGWLQALPDGLVKLRPVLSLYYAGVLLQSGEVEGTEARLRDAERWLKTAGDMDEQPQTLTDDTYPEQSRMVVVDEAEFRRLPGSIAVQRAGGALALGDVAGTMKYARRALELVSEDDHLPRGAASALLGLAYWTTGDLEAAHRSYSDGMARLQKAGHISDVIGCTIALADIRIAQGHLREAMRTYERGLQLATKPGSPVLRGAADMHVGMSGLYRERDDLSAATQHLLRSKELGELMGLPQNPYRWCAAMARIRGANGDLDGALELLQEAERLYVGDFSPNVRPIAAMKARVWAAQGSLGEAFDWARTQGLSVADDLSYLHEFEHITLARVLLARCQRDPAEAGIHETMGLLERLLQSAQAGGRMKSVIEILVLLALAHQALGDISAALVPLEHALSLAEPEDYVRIFVDEGLPMSHLLHAAAARDILPAYSNKLLAVFESGQEGQGAPTDGRSRPFPVPAEDRPFKDTWVEPMSQRELDVLRLFRTELSGPEIAQELVIALSTVRTHTKSIYSKLNVNNRRAAVKRAEELHLI
jgi:LuxR family transcriptional regulator, maltose regulon positive regulatory protein